MSTPINPNAKNDAVDEIPSWDDILDALDITREIKPTGSKFELDENGNKIKGTEAVLVGRRYDKQRVRGIWVKKYKKNKLYGDLTAFNDHERNMIKLINDLPNCYHYVGLVERTYFIPGSYSLETSDQGPAIDKWLAWPVSFNGKSRKHIFLWPGNYLRFARSALISLNRIHEHGFVHLDLNEGNWCMRAKFAKGEPDGDALRLEPDFNNINLIDFGCSIHESTPPLVYLPLTTDGVSAHLRKILAKTEAEGKTIFDGLSAGQSQVWNIDATKPDFDNARYDPQFWAKHARRTLDEFRTVDWREDYWRFGSLLARLRHRDINSFERWSKAKPGDRSIDVVYSQNSSVNKVIFDLAEKLDRWGNHELPDNSASTEAQRRELLNSLRKKTFDGLLKEIDAAIAQLGPEDEAPNVVLLRKLVDPPYAQELKELERKRQQRLRLWKTIKTPAQQMRRLGKPMAALAATVLLAYPAILQKWNAPAPEPLTFGAFTLAQSLIAARGGAQEHIALLDKAAPEETERKALAAAAYPIVYQSWLDANVGTPARQEALKPLLLLLSRLNRDEQARELDKLGADYWQLTHAYLASAAWWQKAGPPTPARALPGWAVPWKNWSGTASAGNRPAPWPSPWR